MDSGQELKLSQDAAFYLNDNFMLGINEKHGDLFFKGDGFTYKEDSPNCEKITAWLLPKLELRGYRATANIKMPITWLRLLQYGFAPILVIICLTFILRNGMRSFAGIGYTHDYIVLPVAGLIVFMLLINVIVMIIKGCRETVYHKAKLPKN